MTVCVVNPYIFGGGEGEDGDGFFFRDTFTGGGAFESHVPDQGAVWEDGVGGYPGVNSGCSLTGTSVHNPSGNIWRGKQVTPYLPANGTGDYAVEFKFQFDTTSELQVFLANDFFQGWQVYVANGGSTFTGLVYRQGLTGGASFPAWDSGVPVDTSEHTIRVEISAGRTRIITRFDGAEVADDTLSGTTFPEINTQIGFHLPNPYVYMNQILGIGTGGGGPPPYVPGPWPFLDTFTEDDAVSLGDGHVSDTGNVWTQYTGDMGEVYFENNGIYNGAGSQAGITADAGVPNDTSDFFLEVEFWMDSTDGDITLLFFDADWKGGTIGVYVYGGESNPNNYKITGYVEGSSGDAEPFADTGVAKDGSTFRVLRLEFTDNRETLTVKFNGATQATIDTVGAFPEVFTKIGLLMPPNYSGTHNVTRIEAGSL